MGAALGANSLVEEQLPYLRGLIHKGSRFLSAKLSPFEKQQGKIPDVSFHPKLSELDQRTHCLDFLHQLTSTFYTYRQVYCVEEPLYQEIYRPNRNGAKEGSTVGYKQILLL